MSVDAYVTVYRDRMLARSFVLDLLDCPKLHWLIYSDYILVGVLGSRMAGHFKLYLCLVDRRDRKS